MQRFFGGLFAIVAVAAAVGGAPALAGSGEEGGALERRLARGDHRGFVAAIELSYYLLTEYSKNSGSDLRFQLSEFKTYRPHEFGTLIYGDLAAVTDGWTIDILRRTRTDQREARRLVEFVPTWKETGHEPMAGYSNRALRDVLADIVSDRPEMSGQLQAVTTFRVRAELADRAREYRAAFLWAADQGPGGVWLNLRMLPLDGITRGLDHALSNPIPPGGRRIEPAPFRQAPFKSTCSAGQTVEIPDHQSKSGNERHVGSGRHYAEFGSGFRCSCSESCTSTCEPYGSYTECWDQGPTTSGFHVIDQAYDASVAVVQAATTEGAKCASAYICALKQCAFPNCAFSVSVSVQGQTASFSHPGSFWESKNNFTASCAPCTEVDSGGGGSGSDPYEPENQTPSPPPGGGGGGGGCYWSCSPSWSDGVYSENCTVICS